MLNGLLQRLSWPLAFILILAAFLRIFGIGFGLPALNDPDELMFQMGAVRMLSGPTLNPGWFGHPGTTTIYLLAVSDVLVFAFGWIFGWFSSPADFANAIYGDPSWVMLPGRIAMALFSVLSVWLTYRLGRELFGRRTGVIAAALLAINPVHVWWSQVIRTDIMAICFMLLCLLAALRVIREGSWRDTVWASIWLALAVATKWPFAIAGFSVLAGAGLRLLRSPSSALPELQRGLVFGALAVVFLLVISPYLVLDYHTVLRNLQGEAQLQHLGATGGGPLFNASWYIAGPLLSGLGLAGLLLAIVGLALMCRSSEAVATLGPVILGFFIVLCTQHLVWERWTLPLMPPLSIVAGLALSRLVDRLGGRFSKVASAAALPVAAILCCLQPLAVTVLQAKERTNDTRQLASEWAHSHFAPGSKVMIEHFGFDMLGEPWRFAFPLGEIGCVDVREFLENKVQYKKIEGARGGLANVDYGTMPADVRSTCQPDYAILTQYDRYKAERHRFPAQYAAYAQLLKRGEIIASFVPQPGLSGGPVVRIVKFNGGAAPGGRAPPR